MRLRPILIHVLCSGIIVALAGARLDAAHLEGTWWGEAPVPGGGMFIQIESLVAESDQVSISIPKLGLFAGRPRSLEAGEGGLTMVAAGAGVTVEIRISSSGNEGLMPASIAFIAGPQQVIDLGRFDFTLEKAPPVRRLPGAVRHDGSLELPGGGMLPITVVFAEFNGVRHGLIDIPAQGVQGLVLLPAGLEHPEGSGGESPIEGHPDARAWRIPVPMEATLVVRPNGESLLGRFRQGPLRIDVVFRRVAHAKVLASRRPQDPGPPFPYREIELEVATPDGHVLSGTLLVPGGEVGPDGHPSVVLVTGSGPQNRDGEIFGHRPFRVLADHLARAGIASLRFDDRGMAGSTGDFTMATTLDLASDAAAVLTALRARPETDASRCGLIGHSEGGAIAAIIAAGMAPGFPDASAAFVVSLAGTGVDGRAVLLDQLPRLYRAQGLDEDSIRSISEAQKLFLGLILDRDASPEARVNAFRKLQRRQLLAQGMDLDEEARRSLEMAGLAEMRSPWMTTFVRFDPAEAWRQVRVPVLAVNGTLDTQVSPELNLGAIAAAIEEGGGQVEVARLEGLNHMLQPAKTGGIDEYASIDVTMDEHALARITAWIREHTIKLEIPLKGAR